MQRCDEAKLLASLNLFSVQGEGASIIMASPTMVSPLEIQGALIQGQSRNALGCGRPDTYPDHQEPLTQDRETPYPPPQLSFTTLESVLVKWENWFSVLGLYKSLKTIIICVLNPRAFLMCA